MTIFRYQAMTIDGASRGATTRGEMAGDSPADVRASLRRIGLQVIDIREVRARRARSPISNWFAPLIERLQKHHRARHRASVSELYDSIATMLESGLPLLDTIETVQQVTNTKRSAARAMLAQLRETLRSGEPLAEAMEHFRGWFDPLEVAMVRAGYHAGDLPHVLRRLADRHERSEALNQKIISALAYPAVITTVGLGVVVFLSNRTLPDLVRILVDAGVEPPGLTMTIIAIGQTLLHGWAWIALGLLLLPLVTVVLRHVAQRHERVRALLAGAGERLRPLVLRRLAVAQISRRLAELARCGVPFVEALRIIAPTSPGPLRRELDAAALAVERGDDLASALHNERWFDAEFRQLLSIGQASGELDDLLERLAERYTRQATRLIDRATALLEPAVILALAALIGIVVMAAILPLVRLQEVL